MAKNWIIGELFILTLSGLSTLTGHRAATCQAAKLLIYALQGTGSNQKLPA